SPTMMAHRFIAEGDYVVVECHGQNTTTTAGKAYNNTYCFVHRVTEGKVHEITEYLDTELVTAAFGREGRDVVAQNTTAGVSVSETLRLLLEVIRRVFSPTSLSHNPPPIFATSLRGIAVCNYRSINQLYGQSQKTVSPIKVSTLQSW